MLLTVAGPPHHVSPDVALNGMSLRRLIAFYLATRQWRRDQQAERLEDRALRIRLAVGSEDARHYAAELEAEAQRLRWPEVDPEPEPLDPAIDRILRPYAYVDAEANP